MTYDASDRKQVRRAEKGAALAERNRVAYIRHIMSEPFGRAWMHDFLATAGMFHEQFAPANQYMTAFNLGKVALAKPIWADVFSHCPNEYILMMQEQALKEAADGRRSDPDADRTATPTGPEPDSGRDDNRPIDGETGDDPGGYVNEQGLVQWPRH